MGVFLLAAAVLLARKGAEAVLSTKLDARQVCICIDAGHGGDDPGKIGVNDEQEKDLNLQIAYKLKTLMEQQDIKVVMLRETDDDLSDEGAKSKKVSDMQNRVAAIEESKAILTVSIHQNSYPDASVKGAQVFYYSESAEGKLLAECIQDSLKQRVDTGNTRQAKANDSYYMLKKTPTPTVIVECGFLSSYEESALLSEELYQERLAWAILMGVMQYLNQ
ncbi:N-acetylmuramoyl-L-alanine amidase AmiC precursor [uncultured Roseburia sp.]|nr:N-acetylmuramoyl-L-alanine amidase [Brotonthovivens ammoniilytica]SCI48387.1 N-acetylmuramoyl-L-alanine amidase AmiC precursor [uncultured Roseburia sp.]